MVIIHYITFCISTNYKKNIISIGHFKVLRKNLKSQHDSIKSNTTAFKNLTKEVKTLTNVVEEMNSNLDKIAFKLTMDTVDLSGKYLN